MNLFGLFTKPSREPLPKTVRDDDLFIASYPKSGNTWQRFLVANLLRPNEEVTFLTIREIIPDVHQVAEEVLAQMPSPRILKCHEAYTPRYPKAIYVTRDPRSVAVSMYHFLIGTRKFSADRPLDDFIGDFVRGACFRRFRSWGENVSSWLAARDAGQRPILIVRYEDLKMDTVPELRRIATFLGVAADETALQAAAEKSSFARMQRLETERTVPRKNWDHSRNFFRKGALDEWKELFSSGQNEMICRAFGAPMRRMNYL